MKSPHNVKKAQRVADRITSLSNFLPRIVERARPIMNLLKKTKNIVWDDEGKEAFRKLKVTLATPLILSKPDTSKRLIVFLVVSIEAISTILVHEEGSELRPMYFVNRVLHDPKTRYQMIEKVALTLVNVACHLHQYISKP